MNMKAKIIRTFQDKGALLASASVTFDDNFIVKNLRVINGTKGLFVAMPNFQSQDGRHIDTCFPLNPETRAEIHRVVLEAYEATEEDDSE